jgi:amino-acid N-acetyltransferase
MSLIIRPAAAEDLEPTIELLQAAGLPSADISAKHLLFSAENNQLIQGIIGRESFGDVALLRSLVVSPDARGVGIGAALITALEAVCRVDSVGELWLLTLDADKFFAKLGFVERDRADAPDAIRNTQEFSELCPGDAVLMSKRLD